MRRIRKSNGNPFRSFGEQRGTDRTGLGLGLFIARKAVRAHGGDIDIRNLPSRGCVFSIEIPLLEDRDAISSPLAVNPAARGRLASQQVGSIPQIAAEAGVTLAPELEAPGDGIEQPRFVGAGSCRAARG